MANSTVNRLPIRVGETYHTGQAPVHGGAHIFAGCMIAALASGGMAVPGSTASSGAAFGVSTHEQDATSASDDTLQVRYETDSDFVFDNDTAAAFSDSTPIGTVAYMVDDHTVSTSSNSGARFAAGTFRGMLPEGPRIHISGNMPLMMAGLAS